MHYTYIIRDNGRSLFLDALRRSPLQFNFGLYDVSPLCSVFQQGTILARHVGWAVLPELLCSQQDTFLTAHPTPLRWI